MSADRWVRCPHCMEDAAKARQDREREVEAMYGKVSMDEWKSAAEEVAAPFDRWSVPESVREDWEIGLPYEADDFFAFISYKARCTTCGAKASATLNVEFKR